MDWIKRYTPAIIIILHVVGVAGLLSPWQSQFVMLTPFNLISCFVLLMLHHKSWSRTQVLAILFVGLFGFVIEVIGVNTGWPFGQYEYGPPFGPQWKHTPFLIGLNWIIMVYGVWTLLSLLKWSSILRIVVTGLTVALIDIIIEPVAIYFNFWSWEMETVPIQNYLAWIVIGGLLATVLHVGGVRQENEASKWVMGAQVSFFTVLYILILFVI